MGLCSKCSKQSPAKAMGVCVSADMVEGLLRKGRGRGREPLGKAMLSDTSIKSMA